MIFIKKANFVFKDNDIEIYNLSGLERENGYFNFEIENMNIYVRCENNSFDFKRETMTDSFSIVFKEDRVESSTIKLLEQNVKFDLPLVETEYIFNDKMAIFRYKIDNEDETIKTIEIRY